MKQSVADKPSLLPIWVSIDDLRDLVRSIQRHFPNDVKPSIRMEYKKRSFSPQNLEELRPSDTLPDRLTRFSVLTSSRQDDKSFYLAVQGSSLHCDIEGPDGAWCASIKHEVETFIKERKRWFWWVRKYRIGIVLWISYNLTIVPLPALKLIPTNNITIAAYLLVVFVSLLMFGWWDKLFPWAVLIVRQEQSCLKKYQEEIRTIGVLFGIIGVLGTLLFYLATILPKIG